MPTSDRWKRALGACLLALTCAAATAQVDDSYSDEPAYIARLADRSMLIDGAVKPSGDIVVVGERGHVLLSSDGGQSWTQSPVPTRSLLTAVYFFDDNNGWAVGHDTVILRTTDGGASWSKVYFDPADQRPLFGVLFTDANNGMAVGAYGLYMTTSDGGQSWEVRDLSPVRYGEEADGDDEEADDAEDDPSDDEYYEDEFEFFDYHLNHITADAAGRLYIAAEAGHFFRSDDGGENWIAMNTPYEGSYYATVPLEGDSLLLCAMRGHLLRSDDAGVTLKDLDTDTLSLLSGGAVTGNGTVLVVGMGGALLVSDDAGSSFELVAQPDRKGLSTVLAAGNGNVVLIGEAGVQRRAVESLSSGQ
ncbi:MAG: YCF48-related protein [Pseudomonadota bacterium]